jgi:hypothetical protein
MLIGQKSTKQSTVRYFTIVWYSLTEKNLFGMNILAATSMMIKIRFLLSLGVSSGAERVRRKIGQGSSLDVHSMGQPGINGTFYILYLCRKIILSFIDV